mmetsp:Transcript_16044/g.38630  ORF Transcript_16044/g.38630 Transcript_16044/m.38630 type:complete len:305 (-) Transcript_16044:66-980(-)
MASNDGSAVPTTPSDSVSVNRFGVDPHALRTGMPDFRRNPTTDRSAAAIFRESCRSNAFQEPTSKCAEGFMQANFVAIPKEYAFDFTLFCLRNPRACPVLAILEAGQRDAPSVAANCDVRTDIPKYLIIENGVVTREVPDVKEEYSHQGGLVGFVLGCSFSFDALLWHNGLPPRHMEESRNVSMFKTNIENVGAGVFKGTMVVSMRPYRPEQIPMVSELTGRVPGAHGAPIHYGDGTAIGIPDSKLAHPDYGQAVTIKPGEVPVFWACGVTATQTLMDAKLPLMVSHAPGHMLVTDILCDEMTL